MAEDKGQPDASRFEREDHDVTCCCEYLCCGSTTLIMGEEEAELMKRGFCGMCTAKKCGPCKFASPSSEYQRGCTNKK